MSLKHRLRNVVEYWLARIVGRLLWPPTSVAVLARNEEGEYLTLDVDGHQQLPGGLVDPGEDLKETGRREVKEETGFDVEVGDLLDIRTPSRGNRGIHYFFEGEVVGGEASGSWEGEPEFVPREEMKERVWRLHHSHVHEYLFPGEERGEDATVEGASRHL